VRREIRLACQEQLLPGENLLAKWDSAQRLGFDAIELRGKGDGAFTARLPELREAAAAGVPMHTVCVEMLHFIGDFDVERRADAMAQMREQLSVIAEIGGHLAMTPASYGMFSRRLPPFEPPRSPEQDQAVLVDALGELAEHARAQGVVIALEPLNRYEDHMVNTLEDAADLCQTVGSPALGVAADTYHMNIEEADPCAALLAAEAWLRHVQVSDSNRLEPGAGHIAWDALLGSLAAIGHHSPPLAYECRLSGGAEEVLARSTAFLRRMA
jgi:sugar phosphate isomerase/epimerase